MTESRADGGALRVAAFCTGDHLGAGSAAAAMTAAARTAGVDATLHVLERTSTYPNVVAIGGGTGAGRWKRAIDVAERRLRLAGPLAPPTLVTSADSALRFEAIAKLAADADVVHLHWTDGMFDFDSAADALKGKAVVVTLHDMYFMTGGCHCAYDCRQFTAGCEACPQVSVPARGVIADSHRTKSRFFTATRPHVIATSTLMRDLAATATLTRGLPLHVIACPIDMQVFRPRPRIDARIELGLPLDAFLVLFGAHGIARTEKGFPLLLEAMNRFAAGMPDRSPTLVVFGHEGSLPPMPFPTISLGSLTHDLLSIAYNAADVFVLSSLQEAFAQTVVEAMACGTPVIAFPVGCVPDMVAHTRNGVIAPFGRSEGLADGMRWAAQLAPADAASMREACRKAADERASAIMVGRQLASVYRSAVSAR